MDKERSRVMKQEVDVTAAYDNFQSTDDATDDDCTGENDMGTSFALVSLLLLASTFTCCRLVFLQ